MALTLEERKQLVEEITKQVTKTLKEELLLEYYALERSDFIDRVSALLSPFTVHWCLIRYARIKDQTEYIDHWKNEVSTFMFDMARYQLKKGDKRDKRFKAYQEVFATCDFDTNPDSVLFVCRSKFKKEGINIQDEVVYQVMRAFVDEVPLLMGILANRNPQEIDDYIESL